ncbi:MAG TPA: hypothetical protein VGI12_02450 [Vicinamibacterales bacterium]|jgi:hypothetical protein
MTRTIPDLLLERYALDELPPSARAALDREIAVNPSARAGLLAIARSDAEIWRRHTPAGLVGVAAAPSRSARGIALAIALATAVVTMLAVMPHLPSPTDRIKGSAGDRPSLALYRRTPAGSERLADGDVARAGDLLRVGYQSAGRGYGVILSIDGRGAVTLHLPPAGAEAVPLAPVKMTLLDSAYELDEAPRIERFYFITGTRPFAVAAVLAAARAAATAPATLPLPPGLEQATFAVQKEGRR